MKRIYQLFSFIAVTGLLTLTAASPANAQRGGRGGGGGGFHGGGGGGFSGGGGGFHGGGGFSGGNRGSQSFGGGGFSHSAPGSGGYRSGSPAGGFPHSAPGSGGYRSGAPNRGGFAYGAPGSGGYRSGAGYGGGIRGGGYYRPGYGGGFRGSVGVGIRGGGYYGGPFRGGLYYHGGFYGRYYAPRIGFRLNILPYGYYPFYYGPDQYFYSGGYFYQYDNNEYTVVEPPVGAQVSTLPSNAQSIVIDGQQYYEANGVYYLPVTLDNGSVAYQITGKDGQLSTGAGQYQQGDYQGDQQQAYPQQQQQDNTYAPQNSQDMLQPGEVVQALPPNTRKVKIDGEVYHVDQAGIYYHEERDQNGRKIYRVTDVEQQ